MKKLYYICCLFLFIGLASCYEDKGNYDYSKPYEISIDDLEDVYSCLAWVDTLKLNPVITPVDGEFDYFWGIYPNLTSGTPPKQDTICTTRELRWVVDVEPGNYTLIFGAKEKKSGITFFKTSRLSVETALTSGWYILRSKDGYTDIDVVSDKGVVKDLIASNNDGKKLKGEAIALSLNWYYKIWNEEASSYKSGTAVFALASEDAAALSESSGEIINDLEHLFYGSLDVVKPQDCMTDYGGAFFLNNGQVYTISTSVTNSGRFGEPKRGNYKLAPYRVFASYYSPLFFDELSSSFCTAASSTTNNTIQYFNDNNRELPSVNNMDADLLFMGPRGTFNNCNAWALMKKKHEDKYLMLKLNARCTTPYNTPLLSVDTIDSDLRIIKAEKWVTNLDDDFIYFIQDGVLYSCNINANYREDPQIEIPEGETVTWMRHLQIDTDAKAFNHLAIATYNGSEYKIYLYNLQAGNLKPNPDIIKGEGKVGAVMYFNPDDATPLP